jgi:hypothetical protein
MSSPDRGLYEKYRVERTDGKPIGRVFVLAYETDPYALIALAAYAAACRKKFPYLARDLFAMLGLLTHSGAVTQARLDPDENDFAIGEGE